MSASYHLAEAFRTLSQHVNYDANRGNYFTCKCYRFSELHHEHLTRYDFADATASKAPDDTDQKSADHAKLVDGVLKSLNFS